MTISVDSDQGPPLLASLQGALADRYSGPLRDPIHHLEIGDHTARIDHSTWPQSAIQRRPRDRNIIVTEYCIDKANQLTSTFHQGIDLDVDNPSRIERRLVGFSARTEHQAVGQYSVEAFVDGRGASRSQFHLRPGQASDKLEVPHLLVREIQRSMHVLLRCRLGWDCT